MRIVFRWLLTPLAALAVWYAVLLCGMAAVNLLDGLCPVEQRLSGACVAPWHGPAFLAIELVCVAAAAVGIVLAPAAVAPAAKRAIAWIAYLSEAAFALWIGSPLPVAVALASGAIALRTALRRFSAR